MAFFQHKKNDPLAVKLKFVDDLSIAECVYLNSALVGNGTKLSLPPAHSILQTRLDEVSTAAEAHDMRLNLDKTKLISFNFTRNYKFEPELVLGGTVLDVVQETMLLGLVVTSNCRWGANTKHIVTKGNGRLWFLRRLKLLGASKETLMDIYRLFCRSVLEFGAPVWSGGLTKGNKEDIERVQRNALKIVFGFNSDYEECLEELEELTLTDRRDKLCLRFAETCTKNEKCSMWFKTGIKTKTRILYTEPEAKTRRYRNSAIPHLTRLLNSRSR